MKIIIYLSYYNGSKFIDYQIESVLVQKDVDVHLYIRDDGSDEKEAAYLNKYSNDENITIIHGENIGYGRSFMWLVTHIEERADYYAFCDQDDVWFDFKISSACSKLDNISEPAAYSALPQYTDKNLVPVDSFHSMTDDIHFGIMSPVDALEYHIFGIGCTYVWNDQLHQIIRTMNFNDYHFAHDNFLSVLTPFIGTFYRDNLKSLLYRQHGKNIGANKSRKKTIKQIIKNKIKNFKGQKNILMRKFILEQWGQQMTADNYDLLRCSVLYRTQFFQKMKLLSVEICSHGNINRRLKNIFRIILNRY